MLLTLDNQYPCMPWDRIDSVVFDVGNVLLRFQPEHILADLLPESKELYPVLMERVFHSPYWTMLDRGSITNEEAIRAMVGQDGSLEAAVRRIMEGWIDLKQPVQEGIDALHVVKEHGKKLYVLSNYHDEAFAFIEKKYSFFQLFDGKIISSHYHVIKPEKDIFRLLIATFQLDPSRTLFIDDSPINIEAALYHGLQGLCLNRAGKLHDFFTG